MRRPTMSPMMRRTLATLDAMTPAECEALAAAHRRGSRPMTEPTDPTDPTLTERARAVLAGKVQPDVLSDDALLPSSVTVRRRVFGLQWFESAHGERGVVVIGRGWSAPTGVSPGENWSVVVARARQNAKEEANR